MPCTLNRAARPLEVEGRDYFFVNREKFQDWIKSAWVQALHPCPCCCRPMLFLAPHPLPFVCCPILAHAAHAAGDMLLEYALVYGDYKGIPRQQVRKCLQGSSYETSTCMFQGWPCSCPSPSHCTCSSCFTPTHARQSPIMRSCTAFNSLFPPPHRFTVQPWRCLTPNFALPVTHHLTPTFALTAVLPNTCAALSPSLSVCVILHFLTAAQSKCYAPLPSTFLCLYCCR